MRLPRFVFPLFLIAFLIIAPLLVAYASGFRYDFKKNIVTRVGFMLIDGKPTSAEVVLSGVSVGSKLPLYLKQLPPDFYSIEIKNPGYHTLALTREVKSNESVVLSPIFLLKDSKPEFNSYEDIGNELTGPFDRMWADPSGNYLVFQSNATQKKPNQGFLVYNEGTNLWSGVSMPTQDTSWDVVFSNDSQEALVSSHDILQGTITLSDNSTFTKISTPLQNPTWDPAHRGVILGFKDHALVSLDTKSGTLSTLRQHVRAPLLVTDTQIGFVDEHWPDLPLVTSNRTDPPTTVHEQYMAINTAGTWHHTLALPNVHVVSDGTTSIRMIETSNKASITASIDDSMVAVTDKSDGLHQYFYNAFDIEEWSGEQVPHSVGRYGGDIHAVAPLHGSDYLLVAVGNDLVAVNPADPTMQPITLIRSAKISAIASNKKGTGVYLLGTIGSQKGMFELSLRDQ